MRLRPEPLRDHERHAEPGAAFAAAPPGARLSLYTFKYVDDIDSVLVFLPPPANDTEAQVSSVFLRRDDVRDELEAARSHAAGQGGPGDRKILPPR